jgi:hypothetical protein
VIERHARQKAITLRDVSSHLIVVGAIVPRKISDRAWIETEFQCSQYKKNDGQRSEFAAGHARPSSSGAPSRRYRPVRYPSHLPQDQANTSVS